MMTSSQADMLVNRLEVAFDKQLKPGTRQLYIEKLRNLPLTIATKRVEKAINTGQYFPRIAELLNADEDQQNVHVENSWLQTADASYAIYRTFALVEMAEDAYWLYLTVEEFRRQTERQWQETWRQQWSRQKVRELRNG